MSTVTPPSVTQVNSAVEVMARDRHRLSRLKSGQQANPEKIRCTIGKIQC